MIGSTVGTWLNYGSTVVFQILFARAFGASADASAFFIAIVLAVSVASTVTTTIHVIGVPRLVSGDGSLRSGTLRVMAVGLGLLAAIGVAAVALGVAVLPADSTAAHLLLPAGVFFIARAGATLVETVVLARGHRFVPAAAPFVPSLIGAAYLLLSSSPTTNGALMALAVGSVIELVAVGVIATRGVRIVDGGIDAIARLSTATAIQLALLSLLPPLQRVLSNVGDEGGAAVAQYGFQSMQVGQQLLVGGVAVAAFADWSRLTDRAQLGSAMARVLSLSVIALALAAGIALVAAPTLVRLAFERGNFGPDDEAAVSTVIRLGAIGFATEGIALLLSQVLIAARANWDAIRLGLFRFAVTATATIAGGLTAGATGVAAGYSVASVLTLVASIILTRRCVQVPQRERRVLFRSTGVAAIAGLAALGLIVLAPSWSDLLRAASLAIITGSALIVFRLPIGALRVPTRSS